jgi:hypothetical protein
VTASSYNPASARLQTAREATRYIVGGILDVLEDEPLLSGFMPGELLGPRSVLACMADDFPQLQRRGRLVAARCLISLAEKREALVARGAELLEAELQEREGT